jgi:DNA-binding CsgD family transcriptional regulator
MTMMTQHLGAGAWADRVLSAPDIPALHGVLRTLAGEIGFTMPSYCLILMPEARLLSEATLITFPSEWERRYMAQGYFRDDPAVLASLQMREAFAWRDIAVPAESRARHIMAEAADFGVRDGMTVPLHGGPLTGLCSALPDAPAQKERDEILAHGRMPLTVLTLLVHERARQLFHRDASPRLLTRRERECVRWLAVGKTGMEIADILSISNLTVTQHLKSAMRKLDASTRAQLAVRAVALGLVDPV